MTLSNEELLEKANLTTADFGGAGEAPLSIDQVEEFILLMTADQALLPEVRVVTNYATKWQESVLDFSSRIAKPGTEFTRLSDAAGYERVKPATSMVELSTVLIRGEVPVSDEALEDAAARNGFSEKLTQGIANRFGYDLEELAINGDTALDAADVYLDLLDGYLKQAQGSGGHVYDAVSDSQDYQKMFRILLTSLPERWKRNIEVDGRYYVPSRLVEKYRDMLAARGTALGDLMLTRGGEVRYQGILVKGVPNIAITAASPDTSFILLTNRQNLYFGVRRAMKMESFRDPREGGTSFIVSARVDAKIAFVEATAIAKNVDVEP